MYKVKHNVQNVKLTSPCEVNHTHIHTETHTHPEISKRIHYNPHIYTNVAMRMLTICL